MHRGLPPFKKDLIIDTDTAALRLRAKYSDKGRCLRRSLKNGFITETWWAVASYSFLFEDHDRNETELFDPWQEAIGHYTRYNRMTFRVNRAIRRPSLSNHRSRCSKILYH